MASVREIRRSAAKRLSQAGVDAADFDASLLLARVLGVERHRLAIMPEDPVDSVLQERFEDLLAQRLRHVPMAYVLGRKEFYGVDLAVAPGVLVPRPDTETLVELALARLPSYGAHRTVLDAGTGSGCIALAIQTERPQADVVASERSPEALRIAQRNLKNTAISLVHGSWLTWAASEAFDLVVSNPPYIDRKDLPTLAPDLSFEPSEALFAPNEGLADLQELIETAPRVLKKGGWLLLEHGYTQGPATRELAERRGFQEVETAYDLANRERCLQARWPG